MVCRLPKLVLGWVVIPVITHLKFKSYLQSFIILGWRTPIKTLAKPKGLHTRLNIWFN